MSKLILKTGSGLAGYVRKEMLMKYIKVSGKVCIFLLMTLLLLAGCSSFIEDVEEAESTLMYDLNIDVEGEGTVVPEEGSHSYEQGQLIQLEALPADGWLFEEWQGEVNDSESAISNVLMDQHQSVTAVFVEEEQSSGGDDSDDGDTDGDDNDGDDTDEGEQEQIQYSLYIDIEGEGWVKPDSGREHLIDEDVLVGLEANPAEGWVFDKWQGAVSEPDKAVSSILMDQDHNISAVFKPDHEEEVEEKMTLFLKVEGIGSVKPKEGLTHSYDKDEVVDVKARPGYGWEFVAWQGEVADSYKEQTTVTLDQDRQLTAVFQQIDGFFGENEIVHIGEGTSDGYNLEVFRFTVTNAEYLEFLNDRTVSADGSYYGKKLIDIGSAETQIGHNGEQFVLIDWEDPFGTRLDVANYPVVMVSWYGAVAYSNWLSEEDGLTPAYDNWQLRDKGLEEIEGYRLPSVDEWDFVARGGQRGGDTLYSGSDDIGEVGWYWGNADSEGNSGFHQEKLSGVIRGTMPVGQKEPNELGIYDLSGSVWEWTGSIIDDGTGRIRLRGGSWRNEKEYSEVGSEIQLNPEDMRSRDGFRPVRTVSKDS